MHLSHYTDSPACGTFTAELAPSRAHSTLSYDGRYISEWGDGKQDPDDWNNSTIVRLTLSDWTTTILTFHS